MKIVDRINSKGAAGSWAAEQLKADAKRLGTTMAALFRERVRKNQPDQSIAFTVPAKATRAVGKRVYYKFKDGSKDDYILPDYTR